MSPWRVVITANLRVVTVVIKKFPASHGVSVTCCLEPIPLPVLCEMNPVSILLLWSFYSRGVQIPCARSGGQLILYNRDVSVTLASYHLLASRILRWLLVSGRLVHLWFTIWPYLHHVSWNDLFRPRCPTVAVNAFLMFPVRATCPDWLGRPVVWRILQICSSYLYSSLQSAKIFSLFDLVIPLIQIGDCV
jgi:hypothetical protein